MKTNFIEHKREYSRFTISNELGVYNCLYHNEGIVIHYGNYLFEKVTSLTCTTKQDKFKMFFVLKGEMTLTLKLKTLKYHFESFTHNIIHATNEKQLWEWQNKKAFRFFEIEINEELLKKYICKKTYNKLLDTKVVTETNIKYVVTDEMNKIILDIINCERKGNYKKLYIESKIIYLLLLQLEQIKLIAEKKESNLKESDIIKMQIAEKIILTNLKKPLSLHALATQIGSNEFTLKKTFKLFFGTTVFGYINNQKMIKAQELLTKGNLTISEISEIVGYKNPTHFTTAFKKKYGILPSLYKISP